MRGGGEGDLGGSCCDTSSTNQWPFVVNLLFSDPEEWRRHHCYGACKIALHVIRQPPTNTTKNKKNGSVKILFQLLFSLSLCCSSKIKLLLPWSPAKKINLLLQSKIQHTFTGPARIHSKIYDFFSSSSRRLQTIDETTLLLPLLRCPRTPHFLLFFHVDIQQEENSMTNLFCNTPHCYSQHTHTIAAGL